MHILPQTKQCSLNNLTDCDCYPFKCVFRKCVAELCKKNKWRNPVYLPLAHNYVHKSCSHNVPSVRCLPAPGIAFRLCVLVTHIPCVCACQHLPKASHLRGLMEKFFTYCLYLQRQQAFPPYASNAINLHTAAFWIQIIHVIVHTGLSEGAKHM